MAFYPQLLTGAVAQFQFEKRLEERAVLNRAADESTYAAADPAARRMRWNLAYAGLTRAEFAALDALFATSEGRLNAFTFLDPTANLLGWTEDFSAAVWHKDASLAVVGNVAGPMGDGFQLTNSGQDWAEISQRLLAPTNYVYAFSVWVKGSGNIRLRRIGAAENAALQFPLSGVWHRIELDGGLGETGTGISFAIGLPAGGQADVAGPQVEAQLVAGEYKKSVGRGGVYTAARFAQDRIESKVEAVDWIDVRVSVESRFED